MVHVVENNTRILYIGGFDLPDNNAAAHRVLANAKLFRDLGHSVYLLGINGKSTLKKSVIKIEDGIYDVSALGSFGLFPKLIRGISLISSIRQITKIKPLLVISYNQNSLFMIGLLIICKLMRIFYISDCSEWYEGEGNIIKRSIKNVDTYIRMRILNPNTDGIIAISKYLFEFYLRKVNSVLIPPLVDSKENKWSNSIGNSAFEARNEELEIVYAGSPGRGRKDKLDLIIKVLAKCKENDCPPFLLTIIGLSKEEVIRYFFVKNEIDMLDSSIRFFSRMNHLQVLEKLKKADYTILIREKTRLTMAGFPTKIVESISCKIPVITNLHSNIVDYLIDGHNSVIISDDMDEAYIRIKDIIFKGKGYSLELKRRLHSNCLFDYRNYYGTVQAFLETLEKTKKRGKHEESNVTYDKARKIERS